jgi:hypothetical protein
MNLKFILLILIIISFIVYLIYQKVIIEPFSEHDKNPPPELSPYTNFDLYDKPYSSHAPYYIYQWWKYGLEPNKYYSCDQYRCQTPKYNEFNVNPYFDLVSGKYVNPTQNLQQFHEQQGLQKSQYYNNSAIYCANHPEDQRCPNYRLP